MSDYIPPELISIILARLPVDDVLQCTSVCKSWYDLITSSSFISLHLKLSTPNQEPRLLVNSFDDASYGYKLHCKVHRNNHTFDEIAELQSPFKGHIDKLGWPYPSDHNDVQMIGSINGILCLSYYMTSPTERRILLWNPSLRKSLTLGEIKIIRSHAVVRFGFGFGFLPETNDFKIVKLLIFYGSNTRVFIQVEIYELSTNSWHSVGFGQVSYVSLNSNPAFFLKGKLHWGVGTYSNNDNGKFGRTIVSFDLKNEKLGALSVPNCMNTGSSIFKVSTFKESICLINITNSHWDIWVMNEYGVHDSLTMQFRIDLGDHGLSRFLCFRENGEIIVETMRSRLVSYDPTSNQVMNIGEFEKKINCSVTTYMESLMLINSSNQV